MLAPDDLNARLRRLPQVDEVLRGETGQRLLGRAPRWAVVKAVREAIDSLRAALRDGHVKEVVIDEEALALRAEALALPSLRRVLNATGVVLHTNLGRAPLAASAIARVLEVARGYSNLEYRLDAADGRARGSRHDHVAELLAELCGAEAALVVNNCAAAVLLTLSALAAGKEVIVSRGELVEIGGNFRVPDVMRASGARLVEVGTTNRTRLDDYERAITSDTALLLKVHRSNFALVGFTEDVATAELAALGRARKIPTMVDLGSGSLLATESLGLGSEPTVQSTIAAGADVVMFSGDKLLGGPQAGVICLTRSLLPLVRSHALLRALRPDKLTLAALAATLELYRDGRAQAEIPTLAMLCASEIVLAARAEKLRALIKEATPALRPTVIATRSAVGGGALPLDEPPSFAVAVTHEAMTADALEARLRQASPPLIARIADGRLLADVRTLADAELADAARAFAFAAQLTVEETKGASRAE